MDLMSVQKREIKLNIIDSNSLLIDDLRSEFGEGPHSTGHPLVSIQYGNIFSRHADAIVSPANSFGYMDGGLDQTIRAYFGFSRHGSSIEEYVQEHIKEKFNGELLVGQATIVETRNAEIPYLIVAPTMRLPSNVGHTVNAYLAMRAILLTALENPKINSILMTGLCTLSGRMESYIAARQMRCAYESVFYDKFKYKRRRDVEAFELFLTDKSQNAVFGIE